MVQTGTQRLVEPTAMSRPEDKPKVAIEVLDMLVFVIRECVLAETKDTHDAVVKLLGTSEVRDRDVDVIDADYLDIHGVLARRICAHPHATGFLLPRSLHFFIS